MTECIDLLLNRVFLDTGTLVSLQRPCRRQKRAIPIVFQLQLQLQAFHFHATFAFMFQNGLIWLSVFWWCNIPTVLLAVFFVRSQGRQIADNITVCTAGINNSINSQRMKENTTDLPRGVVNPMPLYMTDGMQVARSGAVGG